jgi:hypothetical protein
MALSRAPYFTALALGSMADTWFGGGLFVDDRTIRLNHPVCAQTTHPLHPGARPARDPGAAAVPGGLCARRAHEARGPFHYAPIWRASREGTLRFEAEWADFARRGELAHAAVGKLFRVTVPPRGRAPQVCEIADFNAARPDPQPAPEWATLW